MATAVQKITLSSSRDIPFNKLVLSQSNVRRVKAGVSIEELALTPDNAFAALLEGRTVFDLAEGLQLRRVRIMGAEPIELSRFNDTMRDRLKTYGLFHEIISWKLRMFVPTDATGVGVLARVLDRYPVERIGEREAA